MRQVYVLILLFGLSHDLFSQGTVNFNNRVPGVLVTYVYGQKPGTSTDNLYYQAGNGSAETPSGTTDWTGYSRIGANGTGGQFGAATTLATLLGAPELNQDPGSLQPATTTTTFRTGGAAGNVAATTLTFFNIPKDAPSGTFRMVVWDNSSGAYPTYASLYIVPGPPTVISFSNPFNLLNIGGDINTAPYPIGLQSFNMPGWIPEPSVGALTFIAALVIICGNQRLRRRTFNQ